MKYVAYYRVSTAKQEKSGLGLEAQRSMVKGHVKDGHLVGEFTEVESGKVAARPELLKAMKMAKDQGAVLVFAKLDRLSRNVAFIATLMESGVDFVVTDMPTANKFTLHIFAALAEMERDQISDRTRKALQVLKDQGVKLGKPENLTAASRSKGLDARQRNAREHEGNRQATALIVAKKGQGASYAQIAADLNTLGFVSRRGGKFDHSQVRNLYLRTLSPTPTDANATQQPSGGGL